MQTASMASKTGDDGAVGVRCPTCGAKPGERCELNSGQKRHTSHSDRRVRTGKAIVIKFPSASLEAEAERPRIIKLGAADPVHPELSRYLELADEALGNKIKPFVRLKP